MSSPRPADRSTLAPPAGVCPGCGAALPPDAPAGLCPRCLLSGGLFSALSSGGGRRFVAPGLEELAGHFPDLDLRGVLGRGGMGAVYEARQVKLDRTVALKVLPPEVGRDPAFAERFLREARTLARLNHPHIVQVYDFGQTGAVVIDGEERPGLFYFLMEYVDGANLRDAMAAGLKPGQALEVVRQVCEALRFAHDRGIVHRDVKPENVLLTRGGTVKIADFGLAKLGRPVDANEEESPKPWTLTGTRQAMGTPHYMAPEQLRGTRDVDHRADIYSLGVVFYELLTGELPVGRFAPPSSRKGVDARLDEVVLKALASEPAERYQSVSDVRDAVDSLGLPGDPATPQVGFEAPGSPSPPGGAFEPGRNAPPVGDGEAGGNVRVTVGRAGSSALDWAARQRAAALSPERRAALGVAVILCGLAAVGGASCVALAVFFHRYESQREAMIGGGLFFTAPGVGCGVPLAAHLAWLNRGMTGGRWAGLGAIGGAFARTALLSVGAAVGAGWAAYAVTGAFESPFFLGIPAALAVAVRRVRGAEEPPVWWPATWGWKGTPPRETAAPVTPVTPRPGRASALRGEKREERAAPAAVEPHSPASRRAAEVQRKLFVAFCLLTGLAGAVAALGASLIAAGAFVADWSDDPLGFGTVLLVLLGGPLRALAGVAHAVVPLPEKSGWKERRPGGSAWRGSDGTWYRVDTSVWLVDAWDCGVTLLWTCAASAAVALPLAGLLERHEYGGVVVCGALAGLLAAGFVTLRRPTAPVWWPVGWTWPVRQDGARGGGGFAAFAPVAGRVGGWAVFRTPPGGLSRPAIWGAGWLAAVPAAGVCFAVGESLEPRGPFGPFFALAAAFAAPALFAPLAVPLLGWAGVRQVRASRARGDREPVWGRRLGVFCTWVWPAAVATTFCTAVGAVGGLSAVLLSIGEGAVNDPPSWVGHVPQVLIGAATGLLVGAGLAAWLWTTLSRAARGPIGPEVRTTVTPDPRDTGAGLSRVFAPKTKRDWTETLAAACAAVAVAAAAGWWYLAPGDEPRPAGVVALDIDHVIDHVIDHAGGAAPPARFAWLGPTFAGPGESLDDPPALTDAARDGLKLTDAQTAAVETAAVRARQRWAAAVRYDATARRGEDGLTTFRLPDLSADAVAWENEFWAAVDPVLSPDQQRTLRERGPLGPVDSRRHHDHPDLIPLGRYDRAAVVGRQGAWFRAGPDRGRADLYQTRGAVPKHLQFLTYAADRLDRGEPAFP